MRVREHITVTGLNECIEVGHDVVLPEERAAAAGRVARNAHNLAPLVDAETRRWLDQATVPVDKAQDS